MCCYTDRFVCWSELVYGRAKDCKQLKLGTNIKVTVVLYSPKELNLALCHVVIKCNVINVVWRL